MTLIGTVSAAHSFGVAVAYVDTLLEIKYSSEKWTGLL